MDDQFDLSQVISAIVISIVLAVNVNQNRNKLEYFASRCWVEAMKSHSNMQTELCIKVQNDVAMYNEKKLQC